jgi:hypothetical protein
VLSDSPNRATVLWTKEWMIKEFPTVSVQRQFGVRSFATFHDDKPMESMIRSIIKWEDFNIYANMSSKRVLGMDDTDNEKSKKNDDKWYYYFTNKLWALDKGTSKQNLTLHVEPLRALLLADGKLNSSCTHLC